MAKIVLLMDGAFFGEYKIEKKRFNIGRLPACDIHLDNLAVSGQHASVTNTRGKLVVKDLGSTNGTLVNGEKIEKHTLSNLDIIQIGRYQLKYIENDLDASYSGFEKTVLVQRENKPEPSTKSATQTSKPSEPKNSSSTMVLQDISPYETKTKPSIAKVKVLSGSSKGKELILNSESTSVGKAGVQVAEIKKLYDAYYIHHIEGSLYPLVNGKYIGADPVILNHKDVFELAGVQMTFTIEGKGLMATIAGFFKGLSQSR